MNPVINDVRFITLSYLWSEDLRLFHNSKQRLGVLLFNSINLSEHVPYYVLFIAGLFFIISISLSINHELHINLARNNATHRILLELKVHRPLTWVTCPSVWDVSP